jgi:hypothetical protein
MQRTILILLGLAIACSDNSSRKRRRADTAAPVDTVAAMDVRRTFEAPPDWEQVVNPGGLTFRQPENFTLGLGGAKIEQCNDSTPQAEVPVFDKTFMERWPLTLAMRRGDVNRIARANGFTLDSTEVGTHESTGGSTTVKRGEGWLLLSGQTANSVSVLFAAVRHPAGCHLVWASRGAELDADTLGRVLTTVRFAQ